MWPTENGINDVSEKAWRHRSQRIVDALNSIIAQYIIEVVLLLIIILYNLYRIIIIRRQNFCELHVYSILVTILYCKLT